MKAIEWYIAGVGAVGSSLAGRFCQGGLNVTLLLKNKAQLTLYQQSALTLIDGHKTSTHNPKAISIDEFKDEPIQHLICCVKAYDVMALLLQLKPHLSEKSLVILIHNGLGLLEDIKQQLPQLRIVSGVCTIGAYCEAPFKAHAFFGGKIHIGSALGHITHHEMNTLCKAFNEAQLPVQWEDNIHTITWGKFAQNCCINLLTVVLNCKNGELLKHIEFLKTLSMEVSLVLNAHGLSISADGLLQSVCQLLNITADNYSSMYTDVHHGKPTELHYLNEHLVSLAKEKNMKTPLNSRLLDQFYETRL